MSGVQVANNGTQYAVKKRRRPQTKKEKEASLEETKTNPSKRHRDRLNTELDHLAKSIPFTDEVLNKLDKLSILRLAVAYFRNKTYYAAELPDNNELEQLGQMVPKLQDQLPFTETESQLSLMALHGFIVVVTQDYNIFHVSETVQDYLGFPQCDVMNQSMLDLIHAEDREIFQRHMQLNPQQAPPEPPQEGDPPTMPEYAKYGFSPDMFKELSEKGLMHRSFICRLRCLLDNSSGFLALHFTGHLRIIRGQNRRGEGNVPLLPETALFLLAAPLQTPSILEIRTKNFIFRTKHKLDYTPLGIDAKGKLVLGYTEVQLRQRSGYEFIHSADMMHCADAHTKLMRKGESGLTVFRLLHQNNKWLWVTASARLVFRHNRPDYIISTHRPIPDQEGEDHMKKRSSAFRFDFTGHAILYGQVNPIGTRGGPEKNPLNEGMEQLDGPALKKTKMENGCEPGFDDVDRKTLYGALSMQQMDIYSGNLPNQTSDIFANPGIPASCEVGGMANVNPYDDDSLQQQNGPRTDGSDIHFYPFAEPNSSPCSSMKDVISPGQNPYHQNQTMNQQNMFVAPGKAINNGGAMVGCSKQEPPPLHHHPITDPNQTSVHNPNPSYQQQNAVRAGNKRPYPYGKAENSTMHTSSMGKTMPKSEITAQQQPFPTHVNEPRNEPNMSSSLYFSNNLQTQDNNYKYQMLEESITPINAPFGNASVMESMTIKSTIAMQDRNHTMNMSGQNPSIDNDLPVPSNWNNMELVGQQENQIQFDLNKIASHYQTTNPLSKVQNYLNKHPSHAMAIATGLIPDEDMPNINADKVQAFMSSCQFKEPNTAVQMQPSTHPPIAQKDPFYLNQYDSTASVSPNMSLSSIQSMSTNYDEQSEIPENSQANNLFNDLVL